MASSSISNVSRDVAALAMASVPPRVGHRRGELVELVLRDTLGIHAQRRALVGEGG